VHHADIVSPLFGGTGSLTIAREPSKVEASLGQKRREETEYLFMNYVPKRSEQQIF
jgi:hypothetical protein